MAWLANTCSLLLPALAALLLLLPRASVAVQTAQPAPGHTASPIAADAASLRRQMLEEVCIDGRIWYGTQRTRTLRVRSRKAARDDQEASIPVCFVQNFRYFDGSTELKELEHSQMGHTRLEELGNGNATAGVARLWRCERDERYTQLAGKTLVERVTLFYCKRWPTQSERSGPCNRVTPDWACGDAAEQAAVAGASGRHAGAYSTPGARAAADYSFKRTGHIRHSQYRAGRHW